MKNKKAPKKYGYKKYAALLLPCDFSDLFRHAPEIQRQQERGWIDKF